MSNPYDFRLLEVGLSSYKVETVPVDGKLVLTHLATYPGGDATGSIEYTQLHRALQQAKRHMNYVLQVGAVNALIEAGAPGTFTHRFYSERDKAMIEGVVSTEVGYFKLTVSRVEVRAGDEARTEILSITNNQFKRLVNSMAVYCEDVAIIGYQRAASDVLRLFDMDLENAQAAPAQKMMVG